MPQRIRMRDDIQLPLATGGTVLLYGWTLETVVLALWAAYIILLILVKLPEFFKRYPFIGRIARGAWDRVWRRHGR